MAAASTRIPVPTSNGAIAYTSSGLRSHTPGVGVQVVGSSINSQDVTPALFPPEPEALTRSCWPLWVVR